MKKNIVDTEIINDVLIAEKKAIDQLIHMDKSKISEAISSIFDCTGKVVVSGIGKSAFVAQKFVATLNSTGTAAVFIHAADAMHGDVGIINDDDVVVFISKSGGSKEIVELLSFVNSRSLQSIGITNSVSSVLHRECSVPILLPEVDEADGENIVPTSSIVAHMAVCDCISITLQRMNKFSAEDFGRLHPRGTLGKQLATVEFIANQHARPKVSPTESVQKVIYTISSHKLGACCVVDAENKILGIITDGDIRRMLEQYTDISVVTAQDIFTANPKTVHKDVMSKEALKIMGQYNINQLIVRDNNDEYIGMIHLQDLINE